MAGQFIHIHGIGEILFDPSKRAKRINISVRPFKGVRVAVPKGISMEKAKAFVISKKTWIQKHLSTLPDLENAHKQLSEHFSDIDRVSAVKILGQRLHMLAEVHGFQYNRLYLRNQKTRWGSCSSKNNISLNICLVRLPQRLMDYIILHELVHTRIKNHGKEFYTELGRLVSDHKRLEAELKTFDVGLL